MTAEEQGLRDLIQNTRQHARRCRQVAELARTLRTFVAVLSPELQRPITPAYLDAVIADAEVAERLVTEWAYRFEVRLMLNAVDVPANVM